MDNSIYKKCTECGQTKHISFKKGTRAAEKEINKKLKSEQI